GRFILFNAASGIKQGLARWVSGGRLYYPSIRKCAGVSGKTEGSNLVFSDCDEKSHLQQWECSNHTLLNLKGQTLYLHINDNNDLVLSRDMGPRSHWIVFGTTDGPCSRTHRGGQRGRGAGGQRGRGAEGQGGRGAEGQRGRGAEGQGGRGAEGQRGRGAEGQGGRGAEGQRGRGAEGQRGRGAEGQGGRGAGRQRGRGAEGQRGRGAGRQRGRGAERQGGRGAEGQRGREAGGQRGRGAEGQGGREAEGQRGRGAGRQGGRGAERQGGRGAGGQGGREAGGQGGREAERQGGKLFTIEGNAFGHPCQFPFLYKDQWYGDCTLMDSSVGGLWCLFGREHVPLWTGLNALEQDSHPLPDPGQICGLVNLAQQSYWQSSLCSKSLGYVCQKDPPTAPVRLSERNPPRPLFSQVRLSEKTHLEPLFSQVRLSEKTHLEPLFSQKRPHLEPLFSQVRLSEKTHLEPLFSQVRLSERPTYSPCSARYVCQKDPPRAPVQPGTSVRKTHLQPLFSQVRLSERPTYSPCSARYVCQKDPPRAPVQPGTSVRKTHLEPLFSQVRLSERPHLQPPVQPGTSVRKTHLQPLFSQVRLSERPTYSPCSARYVCQKDPPRAPVQPGTSVRKTHLEPLFSQVRLSERPTYSPCSARYVCQKDPPRAPVQPGTSVRKTHLEPLFSQVCLSERPTYSPCSARYVCQKDPPRAPVQPGTSVRKTHLEPLFSQVRLSERPTYSPCSARYVCQKDPPRAPVQPGTSVRKTHLQPLFSQVRLSERPHLEPLFSQVRLSERPTYSPCSARYVCQKDPPRAPVQPGTSVRKTHLEPLFSQVRLSERPTYSPCSARYVCQKDPPRAPVQPGTSVRKTPPTAPVQPEEAGSCSGPWIPYAARCYRLQRTKKTWTEAQTECRKDGGDLASIHNIEQHSFVMSQLGYAAADELWIGMNDVKTPLLFEWSDQSPVTYTRWEEAMLREGNCVLHWTRHGSYCYFVGPETKTFDEAKETCKRSQSYLADVSSRVDNAFLISLVGSRAEQHFWIGLSNQNHIDVFTWTNSNRVRYTHWNAQMPGSRQGCVAMTTGTLAGLWDVLSCTNQEKYICKHLAEGAGPTPEPITPVPPRCHEDWYPVGTRNYCFKFFTQPHADEKTWFEARDYCRVIGGDLLSIHSSTDLQSMNHLSFQHWMEGEPNNYNGVESCAEMRNSFWDEEGSWNDVNCEGYNDWLCEIPKGVTPLPPPNNTVPEYNVTEDGWLEYGGSQYYFNTEMLAMEDARYYCQQRHGDLVVIDGQNENTFLWKKINKERLGTHYIGLTVDLDRSFGWMDGSPAVYQRWDNNQPDFKNNDENCVAMYASMGFWHDYNCGTQMRSICERIGSPPANSTVAPTAPPTGGCPPEWTLYQSKCYKLIGHRVPSTWLEARSFCQSMGANLASIANRREQVFLTTQMTSVATDLWIGLSNLNRDRFVWTDGQAVKYLNWDPNKVCMYAHIYLINEARGGGGGGGVLYGQYTTAGHSGIPIPAPTALPRGWVKLANDSYMVLPRNQTWPEARKQCEAEEGQLASTLDELSVAYLELQALKLQSPLWIGLNRNEWAQGEPSRERPCVYLDVEGTWKTALCNHTYPSVCKQSSAVPPTASSQYPGECIQEEEQIGVWNSPWSWLPFRGHCYSFVNDDIEWAYASTSCIHKGASLVSIEDPEELRFIKSNIELLKDSYSSFWIGLYKTHLVLDYINWAEGQPYDSTQNNYGEMLSSDGSWSTAPRWHDKPYICKKPKVLLETLPTHVSLKGGQRRMYSGLAVVVVLASLCLMGLTALMLYKKTGRPLPSFTKPLVFSAGWRAFDNPLYTEPVTEVDVVNPSTVDTSQLVKHMEEQAQPMITL
ncbi:unnamed protein product, partial [Coregonus sp. 'balchen']